MKSNFFFPRISLRDSSLPDEAPGPDAGRPGDRASGAFSEYSTRQTLEPCRTVTGL